MKPTLVYKNSDYSAFILPWVRDLVTTRFDLVEYDPSVSYDPRRHCALVTYASVTRDSWYKRFEDSGFRVIVEHLWDSDVAITTRVENNNLVVYCPNSQWYLAALEFDHHGYRGFKRTPANDHSFLMLMNNERWHRGRALEVLRPVLNTALYSYNCQGIRMNNDRPETQTTPWQRYMNPDWYNNTAFSVVTESYMRTLTDSKHQNWMRTEVSEKLFKPLAYYHPFVVYGSADTLKYLHSQGFETYNHLFDESYDAIEDDQARFDAVTPVVLSGVAEWKNRRGFGTDSESQRRAKHNRDLFFDLNLVRTRFDQEILQPMLEYMA